MVVSMFGDIALIFLTIYPSLQSLTTKYSVFTEDFLQQSTH